ncbi:hypothetical protein PFMC_03381 [Plasmodium falciparum CAMP/Malaysia]|uniref:Uncharacterized protein n=1 Tax=Plasmodium falciparum (isolate Camp / Malaysia) TaxID=5835 RepID=A0A024X793_PLAFC|nr:hypothetical protein PFMC_03381 [Plasmodium falciparum CAMP/Malaysia]
MSGKRKIHMLVTSHKKNQLLFFRSIFLLQNKLNVIATNNINNYITNSHDTRRHSIPMLWIHDNKTVYSM